MGPIAIAYIASQLLGRNGQQPQIQFGPPTFKDAAGTEQRYQRGIPFQGDNPGIAPPPTPPSPEAAVQLGTGSLLSQVKGDVLRSSIDELARALFNPQRAGGGQTFQVPTFGRR